MYHVHQPGARKGHICLRAFRNFIYHGCCMRHALAKTRTFTFHRPASGQTFDKSPVRRVAGSPHVSRGGTVQSNRLIQSVGSPAEFKHKIQTRAQSGTANTRQVIARAPSQCLLYRYIRQLGFAPIEDECRQSVIQGSVNWLGSEAIEDVGFNRRHRMALPWSLSMDT